MDLQIAKWGNSLALRIPADYVRRIGIKEGDRVEASLRARCPKIRAGTLEAGAEAFYLREPSITLSRRQQAAAS